MTPEDLRGRVLEYSDAWRVLSETEGHEADRIAEAICTYLRRRVETLVAEHQARPVLISYQCDGWGTNIGGRSVRAHGSVTVRHHGRFREEFLLQRVVLRLRRPGVGDDMRMVMFPPRPLTEGKGSWNVWSAASEALGTLRSLGHSGIAVTVYLQDGALHESTFTKFRGKHMAWYDHDLGADRGDGRFLQLSDWVIGVQCTAHACSNALRWGLMSHFEKHQVEDAHIVVQSLINSSMGLHDRLDLFVQRHMSFVDFRDDDLEEVAVFWEFLGVTDVQMLALLVEVNPQWNGTSLQVRAHLRDDPACWEKVTACLAHCWRWVPWSDTRWVRAGRSAKYYLRSLVTGIEGHVKLCLSDPVMSNYHLQGHNRCTVDIKLFFGVCSVCSVPAEQVLLELLQDDRLLRRAPQIRDALRDAMARITSLPESVWVRLANIVGDGVTKSDFQSQCLASATTTVGYMHRLIFAQLDSDPLAMTQGDIGMNLARLRERDVVDPTVLKMKTLLLAGVPPMQLQTALELLRETPCSVQLVEEAHACAAWVMREHPGLTPHGLLARSTLVQVRPCFTQSKEGRAIDALDLKLDRLSRMQPEKVSDRHLVFGLMAKHACSQGVFAQPDAMARTQHCMRDHMSVYQGLDVAQKLELAQLRAEYVVERRQRVQLEMQEARAERNRLVLQRQTSLTSDGIPNKVGLMQFTEVDLVEILAIMSGDGAVRSKERWRAMTSSPAEPPDPVQRSIQELASRIPATPDRRPWWCGRVAANRSLFRGVAFVRDGHDQEAFLFLFAKQRPVEATFLVLRRRTHPRLSLCDDDARHPLRCPPWYKVEYDYMPAQCVVESDLPFGDDDEFFVLEGMRFEGDTVTTNHMPVCFARFAAAHPRPAPRKVAAPGATARRLSDGRIRELLLKYQWLNEEDLRPRPSARPARHGGGAPRVGRRPEAVGTDAVDDEEMEVEEEMEVDEVENDLDDGAASSHGAPPAPGEAVVDAARAVDELLAIRAACAFDTGEAQEFFSVRILGGVWTMANRGVAADSVGGFARAGVAKDWCRSCGFPAQMTFAFGRYGREASNQLAREYTRRGHYFLMLWLEGGADFRYAQHHIDNYTEPAEWRVWADGLPAEEQWPRRKVSELRQLAPRLGVVL